MSYYLAIDQGTTGTTALLYNFSNQKVIKTSTFNFKQYYPKESYVEHDLNEIWNTVERAVKEVCDQSLISLEEIKGIGITNQRETTCAFDLNGTPLHHAIVWQDRRTESFCKSLKRDEKKIKQLTGLPLDPYFSGSKMHWLLKNSNEVIKASQEKTLRLGTIDTFLLYKLTNGQSFKTDATNASRTQLMDLKNDWNTELCDLFNVHTEFLPEICDNFTHFGVTSNLPFLPDGIPITGMIGDQQSALLGHGSFKNNQIKCTYGTGAFVLLNTGTQLNYSKNGLLSTIAYQDKNKKYYALEGSSYIAGAAVQWIRDNLKLIKKSSDIETLAKEIDDMEEMNHLFLFPFFTGIGSPFWVSNAKATITGITRNTQDKHIALACLEGIAFSINDLLKSFEEDVQYKIEEINVDGGASSNNLLMSIQSSLSQSKINRPKNIEVTALGAIYAAAIGNGDLKIEEIHTLTQIDKAFDQESNNMIYLNKKYEQWIKLIKKIYL